MAELEFLAVRLLSALLTTTLWPHLWQYVHAGICCALSKFRRDSDLHKYLHMCAKCVSFDGNSSSNQLLNTYLMPGIVITASVIEFSQSHKIDPIITLIFLLRNAE